MRHFLDGDTPIDLIYEGIRINFNVSRHSYRIVGCFQVHKWPILKQSFNTPFKVHVRHMLSSSSHINQSSIHKLRSDSTAKCWYIHELLVDDCKRTELKLMVLFIAFG